MSSFCRYISTITDSMSDDEAQNDEFLVLENIYLEEELSLNRNSDVRGGAIYCYQDFRNNFIVACCNEEDNNLTEISVSHLPPIVLNFKFPRNYPSVSSPEFTLSCLWLSTYKLKRLCKKLRYLWKENKGYAILHTWAEFLKNQTIEFLEINNNRLEIIIKSRIKLNRPTAIKSHSTSDENERPRFSTTRLKPRLFSGDSLASSPVVAVSHFVQFLIGFNEDRSQKIYWRSSHECGICFESKKGPESIRFQPCSHVYCKPCISEYFTLRIKEGSVHEMPCPYDQCHSQATQTQVEELVGPGLYNKYENFLLTSILDAMDGITYCPRTTCNIPFMTNEEEKLAMCPECTHVFCTFCRMTYHGVAPCRVQREEKLKLAEQYENGDYKTKNIMEKKYGRKHLLAFIRDFQSETWIEVNSKPCPCCGAPIEKLDGCNHMSCQRCRTYFCWLCRAVCDATYAHYNDVNSPCRNQLFLGLIDDLV